MRFEKKIVRRTYVNNPNTHKQTNKHRHIYIYIWKKYIYMIIQQEPKYTQANLKSNVHQFYCE